MNQGPPVPPGGQKPPFAPGQQQPYGVPQQQPYGVPQQPGYGVPQQAPFGVPQQQSYGVPQQQPYGVPQQAPQAAPQPYGAPQQQQPYGAPQQQQPYGAPQQQQPFGAPQQYGGSPQPFGAPTGQAPIVPPAYRPGGQQVMKNPRLTGVGLLAVGVFAAAFNGYWLFEHNQFYPKLLIFTPMLLLLGAWFLVVGQPIDPSTGKPPLWWSIGSGVGVAGGLVLGIGGAILVGC